MASRRTPVLALFAALMLAGVAGLSADAHWLGAPDVDRWQQISWPFLRDGFPPGRAWRGYGLEVYVRPKIGFCGNCDTGVVEDSEVDRVTDIDLLDEHFMPLQEGQRIRLGDLEGRARLYRLKLGSGEVRNAEAVAVSSKCDLVVAIVVGNVVDEAVRRAAHQFLGSVTVQTWVKALLEGR